MAGSAEESGPEASAGDSPSPEPTAARRKSHRFPLALGMLLGTLLGLVLLFLGYALAQRKALPPLDEALLDRQLAQWNAAGPASYELDLVITGAQPGEVHIEVRDGEVTHMTRDGRAPSQRRTWEYWTVPSQFETMRQDLESAQHPQQAFGVESPAQVSLRAEFDPQFGYAREYQRLVTGSGATIEWRVTRFRPLP